MLSPSLWDPFRGNVDFHQDGVKEPRVKSGAKSPFVTWGTLIALGICVISALGAVIGKLFYDPWLFPCAMAMGASIAIVLAFVFVGDYFQGGKDTTNWLLRQVAIGNEWGFRLVKRTIRPRVMKYDGIGPNAIEGVSTGVARAFHDSEMEPAHKVVPRLLEVSVGRLVFPVVQVIFRGETKTDNAGDIPFWYALGLIDSNLALAARELRTDSQGREHRNGMTLTALLAFDLGCDSGIRADLMAKAGVTRRLNGGGGVDAVFDVKVVSKSQPGNADAVFDSLMTPLAQECLLDLEKRLRCQMVIDGSTVYFSTYEIVAGGNADEMKAAIEHILQQFAELVELLKNSLLQSQP